MSLSLQKHIVNANLAWLDRWFSALGNIASVVNSRLVDRSVRIYMLVGVERPSERILATFKPSDSKCIFIIRNVGVKEVVLRD